MCRVWRFLKGFLPSRFISLMEATLTTDTTILTTEDSDVKGTHGDKSDVRNPTSCGDVKESEKGVSSDETNGDPPTNPVEPFNKPPEPDDSEKNVMSSKKPNKGKNKQKDFSKMSMEEKDIDDPQTNPVEPINKPPKSDDFWKNVMSSKKPNKEKNKPKDFSKMPLEEKRSYYRCGKNYVTLDKVQPWPDYVKDNHYFFTRRKLLEKDVEFTSENDEKNKKISLWEGDITRLEIDAIVNAANRSLRGGGGVDGCIHRAAGGGLLQECITLGGCKTGKAEITSGYKLPAKNVIHTVGPMGEKADLLKDCYNSCLRLMKERQLSSVAFCCISTGIYGYPNYAAAKVALETVKKWLDENENWVGRIIFCVFSKEDLEIYQKLMLKYFPCTVQKDKETDASADRDDKAETGTIREEKTEDSFDRDDKAETGTIREEKTDASVDRDDKAETGTIREEKTEDSFDRDDKAETGTIREEKTEDSVDRDDKTGSSTNKDDNTGASSSKRKPEVQKTRGRGRGRGRGDKHTATPPQPSLLSIVRNSKQNYDPKGRTEEKMDTTDGGAGDKTVTSESGNKEITANGKGNEETTKNDGKHTETQPAESGANDTPDDRDSVGYGSGNSPTAGEDTMDHMETNVTGENPGAKKSKESEASVKNDESL